MTDSSLMPYGTYKGKRMIDVPANYLIYLFDSGKCTDEVRKYVLDNMDVLKTQAK